MTKLLNDEILKRKIDQSHSPYSLFAISHYETTAFIALRTMHDEVSRRKRSSSDGTSCRKPFAVYIVRENEGYSSSAHRPLPTRRFDHPLWPAVVEPWASSPLPMVKLAVSGLPSRSRLSASRLIMVIRGGI